MSFYAGLCVYLGLALILVGLALPAKPSTITVRLGPERGQSVLIRGDDGITRQVSAEPNESGGFKLVTTTLPGVGRTP